MANGKLLNANETALMVGISVQTLASWYRWKALHPDHQLAALLPDFTRIGNRRTRYWTQENIWSLIEFRQSIPRGKNGIMGDVTQMYCKTSKRRKERKGE